MLHRMLNQKAVMAWPRMTTPAYSGGACRNR